MYGMRGPLVHCVGWSDLDDLAEVHHRDEVGDVTDDREVVRDEDVRQTELLLQVLEQVDDAGLDRHVERRHRLVEDQQLGIERERASDADALTLAAGELVRIAVRVLGVQPTSSISSLTRASTFRLLRLVDAHRLADDRRHRHARVERRVRVLEHDLHLAAQLAQIGSAAA